MNSRRVFRIEHSLALCLLLIAANAFGINVNRSFSDNMVLQRDQAVKIKGSAEPGEEVTLAFSGQTKSVQADKDGKWTITLDAMPANAKGQTLKVSAKSGKVELSNVVVGDIFLHARQTSIDISLGRDDAGKRASSAYKSNPNFRAISIKTIPSAKPLSDLAEEATSGWRVVDKDSAANMTASAFYLGRDLAADVDVPVGVIDLNLGSAFANSWLSREALLETATLYDDDTATKQVERNEMLLQAELKGEPVNKKEGVPTNTIHHTLFPYAGYNGTLTPLAGTALKAVLLQLGNDYPYMRYQEILESAEPFSREALDKAYKHVYDIRKTGFRMEETVVPRVTREWRKCLGDEEIPFGLIVPPGSDLNTLGQHHREMRELQRLASVDNPGVGIILPGSENIDFSGQPADEMLLASRARAWIDHAVYGKSEKPATGPLFDRIDADYNEATIYFKKGTAQGLKAEGNALDYFEAANVEGDYYPVKARIVGETIRIESPDVTRIARVRYNWNHRPDQGLVNATGLPAIPFRSERANYHWLVTNDDEDLPEEYTLPADEWPKSDVTLINASLDEYGYSNFSGLIGPAGFRAGPFGPNMGVGEILKGSPADGKLRVGDIIYSANGKALGEKSWEVMAAAITESETREGGGKLILGVRRGAENIDVELLLDVLGRYSTTAPYDCPKTEKIISNLAGWLVETGGSSEGRTGPDFLGSDSLFLLGTGNPEYLGFVRRAIYKKMADTEILDEIDPTQGGKSTWYHAWYSMLMGEYYLATGDRNVLPYLKFESDSLAARQNELGGWRHSYPGGSTYGLIPAIGLAGTIGFHLANDAGLDINQEAYHKALRYYHDGQAEMGQVVYGGAIHRSRPLEFEPEDTKNGKLRMANGALASAAILFGMEGDTRTAHLCSLIVCHAWNNTFEGHGGNFFNNFWTPLGAKVQGKKSYIEFWKNYRWYRELGRMYDGSLSGGGKVSAGYGVALVAPRERLQIVGAPESPFGANAPAILKPALDAYWKKDYALAEKLANELIAGGTVALEAMPTVEYFARAAREIPQSIDADLARMQTLMDAGDFNQAGVFLAGLKGVMPADDSRLIAIQDRLTNGGQPLAGKQAAADREAEAAARIASDLASIKALIVAGDLTAAQAYIEELQPVMSKGDKRLVALQKMMRGEESEQELESDSGKWFCLVTDRQFAAPPKREEAARYEQLINTGWTRVEVPEGVDRLNKATMWKIKVLEDIAQAPENWFEPGFDDSGWLETEMPISWRMYHTAVFRTTFEVADKTQFDALRIQGWVLRQQGIHVYLNGELIAKINGIGKTTSTENMLKESVMKYLKNGKNTIAISTRHNWRWGRSFLTVYNDGFDFNLDARLKN
jgi:sialate O-acetylesterase